MALGLLAAFFVAPYARHYDFSGPLDPGPRADRRPAVRKGRSGVFDGLIRDPLPPVHPICVRYSRLIVPEVDFYLECTYFWVPALLAILWFATARKQRLHT